MAKNKLVKRRRMYAAYDSKGNVLVAHVTRDIAEMEGDHYDDCAGVVVGNFIPNIDQHIKKKRKSRRRAVRNRRRSRIALLSKR